jgi:hypothetical protein
LGRMVCCGRGRRSGRGKGGADSGAPGVGAEGVDVFVLGEVEGLDKGLAKVGEGRGGFGFDMALGDGDEEASQGGVEVARGNVGTGEEAGDFFAGVFGTQGLGLLASVEEAEVGMALAARHAAAVAVGKSEEAGDRLGSRASGGGNFFWTQPGRS